MNADTREIVELLEERGDALSRDAAVLIRGMSFVWEVTVVCFFIVAVVLGTIIMSGCSHATEPEPEPVETAKVAECAVADTIGELIRCR